MLPPPDIWDGGWHTPQDHSPRVEDVFADDETVDAELERRAQTRPPGFTNTRGARPEDEDGVTDR